MKNTNTNEFKKWFDAQILEWTEQDTPETAYEYIMSRFWAEAGTRAQGSIQDQLEYWLSGLAINLPFMYCDIIATAESYHGELTEQEKDKVCENWFRFCACKILQRHQALNEIKV